MTNILIIIGYIILGILTSLIVIGLGSFIGVFSCRITDKLSHLIPKFISKTCKMIGKLLIAIWYVWMMLFSLFIFGAIGKGVFYYILQ